METKIYLVCEESSYDNNFSTWAPFKAFKNKEDAISYKDYLDMYNYRNRVRGVNREVSIKEVLIEE